MTSPTEHGSNEEYMRQCYTLFQNKISLEGFSEMFSSLGDEEHMGRFIRSCYMYRKAVNLRSSEPDISMALLCTAVESTHPSSTSLIFKDWLIRRKLEVLQDKSAAEIRTALNDSYQEYVNSETEREGAMYNFRRFLLEHCPSRLRMPPMRIVPTTPPDPSINGLLF
jgi:hypothetical protein